MRALAHFGLATAIGLALAGCSLAPVYVRPDAPVQSVLLDPNAAADGSVVWTPALSWQEFVQAPELQELIRRALKDNRDLRQALIRVEEVRAQYRVQRADQLPALDVTATAVNGRQPASMSDDGRSSVERSRQAGVGLAAFEVDLFGRLKSLSDAAMQEYLSSEQAARAAQIALISEVSKAYVRRESAIRKEAVAEDLLAARQAEVNLVESRLSAGTVSDLDYQQSMALVEQAKIEREMAARQSQLAENHLSLLVGRDTRRPVSAAQGEMPEIFSRVREELRSETLQARPDVMAAEHQLMARNADIGAARAAFFPRISLTGFLGSSSPELSELFDGGNRSWSFSPTLTMPISAAGRNKANLDIAKLRKESAVAAYEFAIQSAFRETADAIVTTNTLSREKAARSALRDRTGKAEQLSRMRFEAGVDDRFRWLEAQRAAMEAQLALLQVEEEGQLAQIDLFKALGGGASYMATN